MENQKIRTLYHYLISLMVIATIGASGSSALPSLPFDPPGKGTSWGDMQQHIFPQGWGFFTRSAQEPLVTPWAHDGSSLSLLPTARASNLFGLNRSGRVQGVEIGALEQQIKEKQWTACPANSTPQHCVKFAVNDSNKPLHIISFTKQPSLCGQIVLLETKPVDYMYRKFVDERVNAIKFANVTIECK